MGNNNVYPNKLYNAINNNNVEKIKKYIETGDDLYANNNYAFYLIVKNESIKVIDLISQKECDKVMLYDVAIRVGNLNVVRHLVENKNIFNVVCINKGLCFAVQCGKLDIVQYFCDKNADVGYKNNLPLRTAILRKDDDIAAYLLSKNAYYNNVEVNTNILCKLIVQNKIDIVHKLIIGENVWITK